jgi:hypothetical protein
MRGRPPTDAEMNFGLWRDLSPELSALDGPVVADEAASPDPRPSVFGGARVAAEAAPTKMPIFCRRSFSPELSALDGPVVADEAASHNPRPSVFGGARVAAEAAPTEEEMDFSSVPPRFATAAASWVKIAFR